ncbi:hypothetical protein KIN20_016070 [Parelaphostrongylus tenuis]|uniref:Secreted protein n=1 Tax=Parelaphostrongylus tenuis TaxID=148309 RepID=A0AAD5QMQ0_PARTN|nr:hypothetical protein KIN20_016070 [Parelaphostrongylus tenuis]
MQVTCLLTILVVSVFLSHFQQIERRLLVTGTAEFIVSLNDPNGRCVSTAYHSLAPKNIARHDEAIDHSSVLHSLTIVKDASGLESKNQLEE